MRKGFVLLFWGLLMVAFFGCSNSISPVEQAIGQPSANSADSHQFWGLWQFSADPAKGTLDVVQLRTGDFHLNTLVFLEPPPLVNLSLDSLQFNGNIVEADIGLRHPFLGLNEFTGFDVCGVLITNGSVTGFDDPGLRMAGNGDTRLLNPDGLSRWWNPAEFPHGMTMFSYKDGLLGTSDSTADYNSTLNAYKYFCDGVGPNDPLSNVNLANRGMFSAGQKNVRHYTIELGAGLVFNYAVDACWVFPSGSPPWVVPDDFPPGANRPEAWRVEVTEVENTLWNDGTQSGGDLLLSIDAYDWYNAALNTVKVESPGNFPSVTSTAPSGGGEGFSTYEIEILNATPAQGLIGLVIDVESDNVGYGDLLPGKTVTAYFSYDVTVAEEPYGPTVTGIGPDSGCPDCTVEHVKVMGTNFANGATFYLKKTGQSNVDPSNVTFVDSTMLEGDLDLLGAAFGAWDVVVKNPGGQEGSLLNGFTVLDVLFVDGDNAGDPAMDGSEAHPFDTIQKGIDAAAPQGNKAVLVDQCAIPYNPFALKNFSHVIGCNWNDGVGWPTVSNISQNIYGNSVSNVTIEGLFFDMTISSGDTAMRFSSGDVITLRGCKFSGTTSVKDGYFVRFYLSSNVEIDGCEFTKIYHRGSDTDWRVLYPLYFGGTNYITVRRSEFHDIGFDVPDAGDFGDSLTVIRVGYDGTSPHNVDLHNLLIYDIYDKTDCIRPSPNPDPQNALTVISLSNINSFDWVGYMKVYNLTVDDIRHADPPESTIVNAGHSNAAYWAVVGGDERVWKNNIASNIIPTDESMISGNSSYYGWWVDNYVEPPPTPQPMDYSLCYNIGKPLPPGANTWQWSSGFINQCSAGVGSYQNYEDINPQFDTTPGPNFYHPTNSLISQGADDGSEMGAFGGPEGDWTPPSQS